MPLKARSHFFTFVGALLILFSDAASGYEIFVYRVIREKKPLDLENKITLHDEFFGHLQSPSTYPSYNDFSGKIDRWNFGFRNFVYLTDTTRLLAQLVTHDDNSERTKFDWHFSLRQNLAENLVLIVGHDSDHDSDHASFVHGNRYFLNRNYIGLGLPLERERFMVEAFTWIFHHSNQLLYLDLSGGKIRQEYGLRLGALPADELSLSIQVIAQTGQLLGQALAYLGDVILRFKLAAWLEVSLGGSFWKDTELSLLGHKQSFYKLIWGLAVPF